MTAQDEISTKPKMKGEQKHLLLRQQTDPENTDRLVSSMNAARRSMGIPEIH